MKIRTKISLLFIFLSVIILFAFASLIYLSAKRDREVQFFTRLKKEAVTKANLFFDAQVSAKTLQRIYKNNRQTISEVEVAIYDSTFHLVYHDASELDFVKETKEMMHTVFSNGQVRLQKIIGILSASNIITRGINTWLLPQPMTNSDIANYRRFLKARSLFLYFLSS
ncbi:hypothetical protein [Flectobacillus sp. BAB-3569]|uniref:hypothetical protein n=1 Tax=Flectobacillus sp. BAB-3569 TaxID=1509483 RepID=UPI001E3A5C2E|nr:hypothetical protein [Flectobacillus sp. BAB-3569]